MAICYEILSRRTAKSVNKSFSNNSNPKHMDETPVTKNNDDKKTKNF